MNGGRRGPDRSSLLALKWATQRLIELFVWIWPLLGSARVGQPARQAASQSKVAGWI